MNTLELPALYTYYDIAHGMVEVCKVADVEARERILLARVAEADEQRAQWAGLCTRLEARIKSLEAINENNLAEAASRIVDLEAVLSETVSLYGKPGGPWNIPSDPGGWLERARAAIGVKP